MSSRSGAELLRQRRIQNDTSSYEFMNNEEIENRKDRKKFISSETKLWAILVIWHLSNFALIQYKNYDFPKPLSEAEAGENKFSEERAKSFLHGLTSFGVRIVGSQANEKLAAKFILNELEQIKASSRGKLQIELQEASGSFDLKFLGGFTNVYHKVKNIVARLSSAHAPSHNTSAILVNCHYDSAPTSPGASDDAVSCASMMEVLRVMSRLHHLSHDVIFLFNGAEETILQASHAFVTQHSWFKDVKAFINLEAAGSNGKELLFQATPGAEWMIELFASVAPDPHLSVLGQEIFQSGAVPSDTDFRIFRDFGGVPGIDMAYTRNGYVYHTRHDNHHQISPGCLQRSGENLLSLVHAIATGQDLTNHRAAGDKSSKLMFMNLSGLTTIIFSASYLFIFNVIIIITTLAKVAISLTSPAYKRGFKMAVLCIAVVWMTSLAVSSLIGLFLDTIGRPMSWFSQPMLLVPLFALPSLAVTVFGVHLFKSYWSRKAANDRSLVGQLLNDSQMLYAALLLAVLTYCQIASSFLLSALLSFFLIQSFTYTLFSPSKRSSHFISPRLIFHFLFSLPPTFTLLFSADGLFSTFIPIMGRSGSSLMCDVVMAMLVSFTTSSLASLHLSLIATMERLKRAIIIMTTITAIFILLIIITFIGQPFSDHPQHPTNKRVFMQHLRRRFHGDAWNTGTKRASFDEDNGLVLVPLDRTGLEHLEAGTGEALFEGFTLRPCLEQPYCGWAFHLPAIHMIDKVYSREAAVLKVAGVEVVFGTPIIADASVKYSFNLTGPQYLNLYVSVPEGMEVGDWSHATINPTTMPLHLSPRKHYFISIVSASPPPISHHFHFTLKCPPLVVCFTGRVQFAVVSSNFGPPSTTTLTSILQRLPPWIAPVTSEATYDSWNL